ncbi:uncharacterized protein LOC120526922 [Polypterus senegalus]|uniref:uncharacterized protein LOC120526922 n=1 Tax=Polypterus senegalus TaxID=55291 RepID=UPI001962CB3F|nr:uncharacterized protein LOC120526922 [Polypterus senegalus]
MRGRSLKPTKVLLGLLAVLQTMWSTSRATHVVHIGGKVPMHTQYTRGYEGNKKYLCKEPCISNSDVLITANQRNVRVTKGKYSIFDDSSARIITANISNFHNWDAGRYWIGVDIPWQKDSYAEFYLSVMSDVPHPSAFPRHNEAILPVVISVAVLLGVLILMFLLVRWKWKLSALNTDNCRNAGRRHEVNMTDRTEEEMPPLYHQTVSVPCIMTQAKKSTLGALRSHVGG